MAKKLKTPPTAARNGNGRLDVPNFDLDAWRLRGLCCPTCLVGTLSLHGASSGPVILCDDCAGVFPILHGSPYMVDARMLLAMPDRDFHAFERAQSNALPEYRSNSDASVSLASRDDVRQVMSHLKIADASVLDVGSGVFVPPEYLLEGGAAEIIGVDPIRPESRPRFDLVGAFAEFLPFSDGRFDVVTAITSTDHFIDLDNALRECRRVLKPGGTFYVWHEFTTDPTKLKPALRTQLLPRRPIGDVPATITARLEAYDQLVTSIKARRESTNSDWAQLDLVDPFHAHHLDREDFIRRLNENGLTVVKEIPIRYPNGGENSFMIIKRSTDVTMHPAPPTGLTPEELTTRVAGLLETGLHVHAVGMVGEIRALLATQQASIAEEFARSALPDNQIRALLDNQKIVVEAELVRIADLQNQQRLFSIDQGHYLERLIGDSSLAIHQQFAHITERLETIQAVQAQMAAHGGVMRHIFNVSKRGLRALIWPFLPLIWLLKLLAAPFLWLGRAVSRVLRILFSQEHALLRTSMLRSLLWPARRAPAEHRRILMLTISMIEIDPRINKIAKSLVEAGWKVDILCQQPTVVDEFLTYEQAAPGIRYIRVKWAPAYMRHWLYYQHIFLRASRELDFDFVHVNDMTTLLVGWLISRIRGKPLIYDAHEMWSENVEWDGAQYVGMSKKARFIARTFEGFMLRYVDSFYSVSPSILVEYERRHGRMPLMLANFPDIPTLDKDVSAVQSVRELMGIGPDTFVTLYLGGLGPARNIEAVIEAHQHLDDRFIFLIRGPDAHIWGEKNLEYARSIGVENRIRILPGVGRDDIMAGLKGADCGIVMLRNLCNNFYWFYPNKFFEYAMGGIPVVVSNFPDVSAHIEKERNGITIDPHDPVKIAEGLRWLADHPEERLAMGRRGRESILREYNWHTAVKVMVENYEALWDKAKAQK